MTAGGFSAAVVPAALSPGLWEQIRGLQQPPEPPTPSPSLSGRPAGVTGTHRLLPNLPRGAVLGWEWGEDHSPSIWQSCPALLPAGGVMKGLSQLGVMTGGIFWTWPGMRPGMRVELHGAPSGGRHHAPHSRHFGPQLRRRLPGLCSSESGKPGKPEEGAGSHQPATLHSGRLSAPSTHRLGPRAWVQPRHPPSVTLNPELTSKAEMEQSSIQPPPLWPFLCHGLLLKAWFL